jgi:hypothetical protein
MTSIGIGVVRAGWVPFLRAWDWYLRVGLFENDRSYCLQINGFTSCVFSRTFRRHYLFDDSVQVNLFAFLPGEFLPEDEAASTFGPPTGRFCLEYRA